MKTSFKRFSVLAFIVIMSLTISLVPVNASPPVRTVEGVFTTQAFSGPDCASPVDFCSVGTVTGDISGDVAVELQTAEFTTDENGTPILIYSTNITITSRNGTISGISNGTINLVTSELNAVFELNSGTGYYRNRRGTLTVSGTSNPQTGEEILPFVGTLSVVPRSQR
ncbi:MAG: hypothetical protein Phog2KO_34280 [Phototrophicaceae bacterium]